MVAQGSPIAIIESATPTIRLRGSIGPQGVAQITKALAALASRPCRAIRVEAGGLSGVEESGLRALAREVDGLRQRGIRVTLVGASRHVRDVLSSGGRVSADTPAEKRGGQARRRTLLQLPRAPQSVAAIRGAAAESARSLPFTPVEVEDIVMAAGEAASNAVRHGVPAAGDSDLRVRCWTQGSTFCLEITDPGAGFDPGQWRVPDLGATREGGLGIYLMRQVMDEVTYTFDARGTTVRLVKRAHPKAARPPGSRQRAAAQVGAPPPAKPIA
ncbi:MAG: ATP-binding protein [Armatimonadetes bacterium]|nr:ATP-binding protein [Armatimonadota bacterium]